MQIHILGYGPITERLFHFLSEENEVMIYSDLRPENQLPLRTYSEFNLKTLGSQDIIIIAWRGMPSNDASKMVVLNLLSKKLSENQVLINLSSVAVYGNTVAPALEKHKLSPINTYGQAKKDLEEYFNQNIQVKVYHLRISNVFGDYRFDDIVNRILLHQKRHESLSIVEPSKIERDFVSVSSLIFVINQIIFSEISDQNVEVFNVSSSQSITLEKLLSMVEEVAQTQITYLNTPISPKTIVKSSISNEKIKRLFPVFHDSEIDLLKCYIHDFLLNYIN